MESYLYATGRVVVEALPHEMANQSKFSTDQPRWLVFKEKPNVSKA